MNELKSYTEYAVSTPTADFVIGFDFNYGEDAVNVTVDDVPANTAGYTVVYLNETTVRLSPSVPSGVVRLQRETDIDQTDHAYRAGAKFIAQTMDENFEQLRHSQQEVRDGFSKLSTDTHKIIGGLDAALELAQDAAQDAQEAAVIAQGAADTVNTIIVGGKVGAGNVLDASGETQQQVNYNGGSKWHSRVGGYLENERVVLANGDIVKSTIDGNTNDPNSNMTGWVKESKPPIESISDLLAINNPKNHQVETVLSRNEGTGKGGGVFVFHTGSTKNDRGMFFSTPTGSWHRLTLEAWHNVQWWGAVGDGVTDATVSIKDAIKAHLKEYAPNKMPLASFCTLYFPSSEGAYVVTETIYTLPYLRLKGDSTKGGSTSHNHTKYMSKIGAKFPNAINYAWIISTENYVAATGELINWDTTCTGEQLDAGLITPSFGSCVEDLWIDNLTPENRIYGGVRFIAAPQSSIERCWIENVDVGVLSTGSWDIRCDVGTVAYKCGAAIWGSSNGTRMNGYLHANTNKTPLPTQMNIFDIPVDKTVGLYAQYAPSISSEMLISERHDHGIRLAAESYMSAQSLYLEANKTAMTLSSSTLNVGNITGVANDYTLKLGGGSTFEVASCQNNNYKNAFFESIDAYAISANIPETIAKADTANTKVFLKNRELKDVVYLSSSTGSDSNSGLISNNPVASLTKALDILNARRTSNQWGDVISDQRKVCTLIILDSADYSPNNYRELKNMDLTIKSSNGNTPHLKTSNQAFKLFNSTVRAKGINIQRTYDNNYQLSQGMFICSGSCSVVVECPNVDLAYPLVSVDPSDLADVNLSIIGGTGVMTTDARYFQTTSKNTAINAFVRLNNTGYDLNGSSNNGIDAPPGAYITKSVSAVLP